MQLCDQPAGRRLPDARGPADERRARVDVFGHAATGLEGHLLLAAPEHHIVPIAQPLRELPYHAGVPEHLAEVLGCMAVDPVGVACHGRARLPRCSRGLRHWRGGRGRQHGGCGLRRKELQELGFIEDGGALFALLLEFQVFAILRGFLHVPAIVQVRANNEVDCVPRHGTHHLGAGRLRLLLCILACQRVHLAGEGHDHAVERQARLPVVGLGRALCGWRQRGLGLRLRLRGRRRPSRRAAIRGSAHG
mmetsp:Transcript_45091/g.125420  ORF Transcript_45091/g.125420 Transcript_45091/m.125420 type:complete len:249 (-) Transcript_45091:59-805(-)